MNTAPAASTFTHPRKFRKKTPKQKPEGLFRGWDFRGKNLEAPPYPSTKIVLTQFGIVFVQTYRQALDRPFMVELFTADLFNRSPSPPEVMLDTSKHHFQDPVVYVTADKLPTPAQVERPGTKPAPNPLEGLAALMRRHHFQTARPKRSNDSPTIT